MRFRCHIGGKRRRRWRKIWSKDRRLCIVIEILLEIANTQRPGLKPLAWSITAQSLAHVECPASPLNTFLSLACMYVQLFRQNDPNRDMCPDQNGEVVQLPNIVSPCYVCSSLLNDHLASCTVSKRFHATRYEGFSHYLES